MTMNDAILLCQLDDIEDPGSKGFEAIGELNSFFVVRRGRQVFGYYNSCPHFRAPLDWKPDAFLSHRRDQILCSMHGALFDIANGSCTDGPCVGKKLASLDVRIENTRVYLFP